MNIIQTFHDVTHTPYKKKKTVFFTLTLNVAHKFPSNLAYSLSCECLSMVLIVPTSPGVYTDTTL